MQLPRWLKGREVLKPVPVLKDAIDAKPAYKNALTGGNVYSVGLPDGEKMIRHFTNTLPFPGARTLCGVALIGTEHNRYQFWRTCDKCANSSANLRGR